MKISELANAPEWLVLADTKDADVEMTSYGAVIWNKGYFLGGKFLGGKFLGGYFRGGKFLGGKFLGGEFLGGYFLGGEFLGGYFLGGEFLGGKFLGGEFLGGYFLGGEFLGGKFRGGYFLGGEFLGGMMMPLCKWAYGYTPDGKIKIGCETKSVQEWTDWFASTEEKSTKRNTVAFKKIQASFEAAKAYLNSIGDINLIVKPQPE